jgi:hypothetical protein
MRTAIMAAVALLALVAGPVRATVLDAKSLAGVDGCHLRIEAGSTNWLIAGFDIFDGTPPEATFEISYTNDGTANCVFVTNFSLDGEPYGLSGPGGDRAGYLLFDAFYNFDATPLTGETRKSPLRRQVTLAPGHQQVVIVDFRVDRNDLQHDGTYAQHVQIEADRSDGTELAGKQIALGIQVAPSARLGLAGAFTMRGGQPVIDLGDLKEGLVDLPLDLKVDSTRRYDVTFDSQGGGRLRMQGTEWSIPYSLSVGGKLVSLTGGSGDYASTGPQRLQHDSLPLGFVIGDTSTRRAGVYSDVLSITVAPQ